MKNHTRTLSKSFWWSVGSLVLMVVGAFGPWAKVADLFTIHGTDGGRDGWVVVGVAGAAALVLLLHLRFSRGWLVVFALLAGLAGAATATYDISDIMGIESGDELFGELVSTQLGIYVALAGSISLALASLGVMVGARKRRRESPVPIETPAGAGQAMSMRNALLPRAAVR